MPRTNAIDTRRTDWIAFGYSGCTHYRIWQMFDGLRWYQRHEWLLDDGSVDPGKWIPGAHGFSPNAKPVTA